MTKSNSLVLLSGGLDSSLAFHLATQESHVLFAITFDYGQLSRLKEIAAAQKICQKYQVAHRVVALPFFADLAPHPLLSQTQDLPELKSNELDDPSKTQKSAASVWVPNRNGLFVNVAASFAEAVSADLIYVGFNVEEAATFPDNSAAYVEAVNQSLSYSTLNQVKVQAPTIAMNKKEIVKKLVASQFDLSLIWSCYRGEATMCGICESCLRLNRALQANCI